MKYLGLSFSLMVVAAVPLGLGCEDIPGKRLVFPTGEGLPGPPTRGLGVGADCSDEDCRSGLSCEDDVCEYAGSTDTGGACVAGAECEDGHHCIFNPACDPSDPPTCASICVKAGDGESGDSCQTDLDCGAGLRCGLLGFETICGPAGDADFGEQCALQSDCAQGLYCANNECSLPEPPYLVPLWEGIECDEPDDDNVEALFWVPGAKDTPAGLDFFQLPFPNDIRLAENGRPDLDGFPTPGPGLLGVDIVQRYVEAIEDDSRGWSTNPTVIFRFSGKVDLDSLSGGEDGPRRILMADVDNLPEAPEQGLNTFGLQYALGSKTNYVCDDWLAVRLSREVLTPGHRHVLFVTTDARSEKGDKIARSAHMDALLAADAPDGDVALEAAYQAYAPLREYLDFYKGSSFEVERDAILTAAVFTTEDVLRPMRRLSKAVESEDAPKASDWVKCGDAVTSPCEQSDEDEGRACGSGTKDYDEYQALISLPIFQQGDAPYLREGGAISDQVERHEDVCMSLSVPKSAAPPQGYPLVIYGHGTGGGFRSQLRPEVAGRLATGGSAFATLAFDQVQHGPRRGDGEGSDQEPDTLFFNFVNPEAARGNPLQGAADVLSMIAFAQSGQLASAADTGGVALNVDPTKIFLFGHSQGSTHSSMALPFSDLPGGVFSGNGGGLVEALLAKKNPVDIASAIPLVVQDVDTEGNLRMGDKHPVLALLQHYIDPADPVNFAPLLATRPEDGNSAKSVFQTFGLNDTYAPPKTLARYIYAAEKMELAKPPAGVSPAGDNVLRLDAQSEPVSGNVGEDPELSTLVCRQYEPQGDSDGHFVIFDVSDATDDVIGFFDALGDGDVPTVPAP